MFLQIIVHRDKNQSSCTFIAHFEVSYMNDSKVIDVLCNYLRSLPPLMSWILRSPFLTVLSTCSERTSKYNTKAGGIAIYKSGTDHFERLDKLAVPRKSNYSSRAHATHTF